MEACEVSMKIFDVLQEDKTFVLLRTLIYLSFQGGSDILPQPL